MTGRGDNLLFIIGFPRSGTKLLRNVLANHAEIFIAHELVFLPYILKRWDGYGDLSILENFRVMHREVLSTYYFTAAANRGETLITAEEWHRNCDSFEPCAVHKALIRLETGAPDGRPLWLGDKSPNYTTHLKLIHGRIPEAKILHIVRDVRDAALSARKIWRKNIFRFAQRWADGNRQLWKDLEQVPSTQYLEIRYEDLVTAPQTALNRISTFLETELDESLLKLRKPSENFGDAKHNYGVVATNTQKYRQQLSAKDVRKIERICADVLARYEYDTSATAATHRLSSVESGLYMVADIANRFAFDRKLGRSPGHIMRALVAGLKTRL